MLELFVSEWRVVAQDVLSFTLIACAFIWGGGPERAAAATWLVVFEIGGRIYRALIRDGYQYLDVDIYLAAADSVAGFCWILIALYANRNYTLWIAGLQVLAMTAHVARGVVESISPIGYMTMFVAPGWFQLFFLAGGIIAHVRRKKKYGEYRDWRVPIRLPSFFNTQAGEPRYLR